MSSGKLRPPPATARPALRASPASRLGSNRCAGPLAVAAPSVVFEDEALLVLNKPALPGRAPETGASAVAPVPVEPEGDGIKPLLEAAGYDPRALTLVHRPDPAASGLLVFAKTKPALDFLSGQFQSKSVEQLYHAFVVVRRAQSERSASRAGGGAGAGAASSRIEAAHWPRELGSAGRVPDEFALDWWIGREASEPARMRAFRRNGGQPALSEFRTLERFGHFAFLQCCPRSYRRHQLRVHLAAAGLPILNDALYGLPEERLLLSDFKRDYKGGRSARSEVGGRGAFAGSAAATRRAPIVERPMIEQVALHASELRLRHPASAATLQLSAPLPKSFEVALRNLRKYARAR